MAFRHPSDQGTVRTKDTPSPDVLKENLHRFVEEWKTVSINGKRVLPEKAIKQVQNLMVHIERGCLSGIKPGRGTNRNERLHRDLNGIMSASKYGLELAYALITLCMYKHNEKQAAKKQRRKPESTEHYRCIPRDPVLPKEEFGLTFVNQPPTSCEDSSHKSVESLNVYNSSYAQIMERALSSDETPLTSQPLSVADSDSEDQTIDSTDITTASEDNEVPNIPLQTVRNILLKAIGMLHIFLGIQRNSRQSTTSLSYLPFMSGTVSNLFLGLGMETTSDRQKHEERLDNVILSWNFERLAVPRDGNCLLYAVAYNIHFQIQNQNTQLQEMLSLLGIEVIASSIATCAQALRKVVVNEWLGTHSSDYQEFLTDMQLQQEASAFLQSGRFEGDLGDLVLLALSNGLKTPIMVFTSNSSSPVVLVTPTYSPITNTVPIYIAFIQHGPGHYDAVCWKDNYTAAMVDSPRTEPAKCTCGKNGAKAGSSCVYKLDAYSTRCPCFNSGAPCTDRCRCEHCQNPHGIRPKKVAPQVKRRRRETYENQKHPLKGRKSSDFVQMIDEPLKIGPCSDIEYLVMASIAEYLSEEDQDNSEDFLMELKEIYDAVRHLAENLEISIPLFERTNKDIENFLSKYKLNKYVYQHMIQ